LENYTGGIYKDETGAISPDHDIEVTGWGEQEGVPYWHVRNSYVRATYALEIPCLACNAELQGLQWRFASAIGCIDCSL
jgi:hypothetical protein